MLAISLLALSFFLFKNYKSFQIVGDGQSYILVEKASGKPFKTCHFSSGRTLYDEALINDNPKLKKDIEIYSEIYGRYIVCLDYKHIVTDEFVENLKYENRLYCKSYPKSSNCIQEGLTEEFWKSVPYAVQPPK